MTERLARKCRHYLPHETCCSLNKVQERSAGRLRRKTCQPPRAVKRIELKCSGRYLKCFLSQRKSVSPYDQRVFWTERTSIESPARPVAKPSDSVIKLPITNSYATRTSANPQSSELIQPRLRLSATTKSPIPMPASIVCATSARLAMRSKSQVLRAKSAEFPAPAQRPVYSAMANARVFSVTRCRNGTSCCASAGCGTATNPVKARLPEIPVSEESH